MNRFFLGLLALGALALMISQAAIAGGNTHHRGHNAQQSNGAANNSGGVMIVETYTASSAPTSADNEMQPLPGDPGVEVAPDNASANPVMVEEDVMVEQQTEGE